MRGRFVVDLKRFWYGAVQLSALYLRLCGRAFRVYCVPAERLLERVGVFAWHRFVHWCLPLFAIFYRLCCQFCCQPDEEIWDLMWLYKRVYVLTLSNYITRVVVKWLATSGSLPNNGIEHFIIVCDLLKGYVKLGTWE